MIPVPEGWVRLAAGPTVAARRAVAVTVPEASARFSPESLSPPDTLDALLLLAAYAFVGLAAAVAIRDGRHLKHAAMVITASSAFQALYGASEYLTGHQHIFGYVKKYHLDAATGTFINQNHFAGYLAMTLPLALALLVQGVRRFPGRIPRRERVLYLATPEGLPIVLAGPAILIIWAAVFLSYSRAGLAVALLGTVLFAVFAGFGRRRLRILGASLLFPLVLFLLWQDVRAPGERFVSPATTVGLLKGRVPIWGASLRMVPEYAILGTGYGTFESAFVLYRPPTIVNLWNHAHNDWLQALTEGGVGAGLICFLVLYLALRQMSPRAPPLRHGVSILDGAAASLVAISLHSLVDFCLRIPAIAVLLAFVLGMRASVGAHPTADLDWSKRRGKLL